jgi:hypothetical protein
MAWGHRLKRLTKRERELCRALGWGCGGAACDEGVEYLSNFSYASVHGHATHAKRALCAEHARQFAMKYCLAWPTRGARIRFEPRSRAA